MVASAIPSYNIEKSCQAEGAASGYGDESALKGCVQDEKAAKDKVAKEWPNYPAAAQQICTAGQSSELGYSYVELMTCFEMQDWKTHLNDVGGVPAGAAAERAGVGSPPLPGQFGGSHINHPLGGAPGVHIH
jgi:hypothetical protein